jgi:hypothetical protein
VDRFGVEKVYILSAGWGLIRADFLTPYYDITFSQQAERWKRRRKADRYEDFRMLSDDAADDIACVGGKDYLKLFGALTETSQDQEESVLQLRSGPEGRRLHVREIRDDADQLAL